MTSQDKKRPISWVQIENEKNSVCQYRPYFISVSKFNWRVKASNKGQQQSCTVQLLQSWCISLLPALTPKGSYFFYKGNKNHYYLYKKVTLSETVRRRNSPWQHSVPVQLQFAGVQEVRGEDAHWRWHIQRVEPFCWHRQRKVQPVHVVHVGAVQIQRGGQGVLIKVYLHGVQWWVELLYEL